jgi:CRP-like cAMP-binding protein
MSQVAQATTQRPLAAALSSIKTTLLSRAMPVRPRASQSMGDQIDQLRAQHSAIVTDIEEIDRLAAELAILRGRRIEERDDVSVTLNELVATKARLDTV